MSYAQKVILKKVISVSNPVSILQGVDDKRGNDSNATVVTSAVKTGGRY